MKRLNINLDHVDDLFMAECEEVHLYAHGKTLKECLLNLNHHLEYMNEYFKQTPPEKFIEDRKPEFANVIHNFMENITENLDWAESQLCPVCLGKGHVAGFPCPTCKDSPVRGVLGVKEEKA